MKIYYNGSGMSPGDVIKLEHLCTAEHYCCQVNHYPSPTHSVCKDTLVGVCVSYPEHVYTWEGYSNRSVSVCVCLSVCLHLIAS